MAAKKKKTTKKTPKAAPRSIAASNKRDVTRASDIIKAMPMDTTAERYLLMPESRAEVLKLLKDIDARTGRRDPHLRPARRATDPKDK
jgi:hypothetical protein